MGAVFLGLSNAVGLTIGIALLVPQLTALQAVQAAESSDAGSTIPVSDEAADQTGLKKGTTAIEATSPLDGSKQRLATAKLERCTSQFGLADLNGDGVLDAWEIARYNSAIRSERQPILEDSERLNQAGFIAACSAISAHE